MILDEQTTALTLLIVFASLCVLFIPSIIYEAVRVNRLKKLIKSHNEEMLDSKEVQSSPIALIGAGALIGIAMGFLFLLIVEIYFLVMLQMKYENLNKELNEITERKRKLHE